MNQGIVLQSHRVPLPSPWLEPCLASVRHWADQRGYAYRFADDALFDRVPADLLPKLADRRVVATDLARLDWIAEVLAEGFDPVVWIDADTLVFAPERLVVPLTPFSVGREVWVDERRVRRQVHNAWLHFRPDNAFLDFYRYAALRMVRAHTGPMVPQFVGPKLLTTLHHLVQFPVLESANVFAPRVLRDIATGSSHFLDKFLDRCDVRPACANLCHSGVTSGEVDDDLVQSGVERLLKTGGP